MNPKSQLPKHAPSASDRSDCGSLLCERKYGVREASRLLNISESGMRRLIYDGQISTLRIGGKIFLLERDLDEFLERGYSTNARTNAEQPRRRERLPKEVISSKHLR